MFVAICPHASNLHRIHNRRIFAIGIFGELGHEVVVSTAVLKHKVGLVHQQLIARSCLVRVRVLGDVVNNGVGGHKLAADLIGQVGPNVCSCNNADWAVPA